MTLRKMVIAGVMVSLALGAAPAFAGKVGFVEVERAVATVKEGQRALKKLEAWAKPKRHEVTQIQLEAQKAMDRVKKEASVVDEDTLKKLRDQAIEAQRRAQDATREFNRELDERQTQVMAELAQKMRKVVEDYAKAHDFDVVFVFKPGTVIYMKDSVDLTDVIIREYDQRFPDTP